MKHYLALPALVTGVLLLVSSTAGAINLKAAGEQYVVDVASANAALKRFDAEINTWTNATPDAEGERQAASALGALETLQRNLAQQNWPRFIAGDIRFIGVEDIASLEEDLREVDGNSSLGNGAFQLTFRADSRTIDSHAFYVRQALGLPSNANL